MNADRRMGDHDPRARAYQIAYRHGVVTGWFHLIGPFREERILSMQGLQVRGPFVRDSEFSPDMHDMLLDDERCRMAERIRNILCIYTGRRHHLH
jgi:hypothetical protein